MLVWTYFRFWILACLFLIVACKSKEQDVSSVDNKLEESRSTETTSDDFIYVEIMDDAHGPDPNTSEAASMMAFHYMNQLEIDKPKGVDFDYSRISKVNDDPIIFQVPFIMSKADPAQLIKGILEVKGQYVRLIRDTYETIGTEEFLELALRKALANDGGDPNIEVKPSTPMETILTTAHQYMSIHDNIQAVLGLSNTEMETFWPMITSKETFSSWVATINGAL